MKRLFDYDKLTGLKTYYVTDGDNFRFEYEQDVSGFLDKMKALRNETEYSKQGIKEEWWHYASIPAVVQMELMQKGINLWDKNATKRILEEINTNYPALKATSKRHT